MQEFHRLNLQEVLKFCTTVSEKRPCTNTYMVNKACKVDSESSVSCSSQWGKIQTRSDASFAKNTHRPPPFVLFSLSLVLFFLLSNHSGSGRRSDYGGGGKFPNRGKQHRRFFLALMLWKNVASERWGGSQWYCPAGGMFSSAPHLSCRILQEKKEKVSYAKLEMCGSETS